MAENYYGYPGTPGSFSYGQPSVAPQGSGYSMQGYAMAPSYGYPAISPVKSASTIAAAATGGYYAAPVNDSPGVYQAPSLAKSNTSGAAAYDATTYSGYDAALYSAAKDYISAKSTGAADKWMSGGSKRGGGAYASANNNRTIDTSGIGGYGASPVSSYARFPARGGGSGMRKPFGGGRGGGRGSFGASDPQHYCETCKISCGALHTYKEHLEGKTHKKKLELLKAGPQNAAKSKNSFFCEICEVLCTGSDAYQAHVRGAKHLKTIRVHQQMGKPLPAQDTTILGPGGESKKVVVVQKVNFVGGEQLTSTGSVVKKPESLAGQRANQPVELIAKQIEDEGTIVGEEYLEIVKIEGGRVTAYNCKLCDCRFTDLNAKDMHMKGRRHRLNYKKKVDPSHLIEEKLPPKVRRQQDEKMRKELMRMRQADIYSMRAMYQAHMPGPVSLASLAVPQAQHRLFKSTMADRYLSIKNVSLTPTNDETLRAQRIVVTVEKALKMISDDLSDEASKQQQPDEIDVNNLPTSVNEDRLLKGVMRVGDLAKQTLLRGDTHLDLVVLCSEAPTRTLLSRISSTLPDKLQTACQTAAGEEQYEVETDVAGAAICVRTKTEPSYDLKVSFTSVAVRDNELGESLTPTKIEDGLDVEKCLEALASLRHAKWFQARCAHSQPMLIVLRLLKDLRQRVAVWQTLKDWPTELLVEKVCNCNSPPHSPYDAIRRFFEGVASGLLYKSGPGLLDPCEKIATDALAYLTGQQREDLTASAQTCLRLLAFGKIYEVLGMERNALETSGENGMNRKRPLDATVEVETPAEGINGKKDKKA